MAIEGLGQGPLDYAVCTYGASRLRCRGPRRHLDGGDYVAVLGGIETFGRFIEQPYPDLLEVALGMKCVNLGVPHTGLDAWLADETFLDICAGARVTVIAVPGAHMLRNRFYTLHTRRNDRVVRQTEFLERVYPDLDLSQNFFVRHLLADLAAKSERRFALIRTELQSLWISRMNQLCARIGGDVVLVWLGERSPDAGGNLPDDGDPPLVTREMLRALRGRIKATIEVIDASDTREAALEAKVFAPHEAEAAQRVPGPLAHARVAESLARVLRSQLDLKGPAGPRLQRRSA
ncbi:hypothetical protein SAMN04488012_11010 [Palleronia salina]|uniref:DUF6473 domain-containing protein n=1 Tax=Palleronia salina TaxID=313368 RepID=A0A1M6JKC1_9RHOB|nr:DUF6473 family protein [Palleronia salina]SHJ47137.1 hypothetical protein SAMN04488012_11010 [Palleronia salina]